ncbi:hypothetical protein [Roseomonas xinghualingensis]|uniref:hypothetical protein n=1 Tax=Roseomonas xinghualingensis TaxID=2986475 RepID=UPI0021F19BDC|nr:hypothetical protein [Roseomonas sp. SXEYE001]MCV4209026.1 hypothetical protein [Roseomonas sp. SXEYE001]
MAGTGIAGAQDYIPAGTTEDRASCFVCAGPVRMGGAASRCLPPLVLACSVACTKADLWLRLLIYTES